MFVMLQVRENEISLRKRPDGTPHLRIFEWTLATALKNAKYGQQQFLIVLMTRDQVRSEM